MDMKCYEFKDGRRIFRWIYFYLLLSIVSFIIAFFRNELMGTQIFQKTIFFEITIYLIIFLVFFRKTRTQVFVNDRKLKSQKEISYMMITKIKAAYDIEIVTDNTVDSIKLIDIDNNYDKYKELLEHILSKVVSDVARNAGSAEKLLQTAIENEKQRYSSNKSTDGKVKLGGWLKLFNVIAHFAAVFGAIAITVFIVTSRVETVTTEMKMSVLYIQFAFLFLINYVTVKMLSKRKSSVKYALAAQPLSGIISGAYASINNMISGTEFVYILLIVLGLIVNVVTSIYMIKIYIEYIDTFERPKQTLTN